MPSTSISQQRLFGWALSCKRGESSDCPKSIKNLADSMSEDELEKYAKTSHEGLPHRVKESAAECIENMDVEDLDVLDEKQTYGEMEDVKVPPPVTKEPMIYPGFLPAPKKKEPLIPDLFKLPMSKVQKHERRLMDFDDFLKRIVYRTHDATLQAGHGQNLTGK